MTEPRNPAGQGEQETARKRESAEPFVKSDKDVGPARFALIALIIAVVIVYLQVFGAGFVEYDDDIHVYANPFLNPPSLAHLGELWRQAYRGLYIPLAYTIFSGIALFAQASTQTTSSIGQTISLDPGAFHVASIGFHIVNALLCYWLAMRLTRSRTAALVCSFVFAMHPLQVESVAWISELRGLSSACFALAAQNLFTLTRQGNRRPAVTRGMMAGSAALLICATACKPAAAALPIVALAMDRVALGTSWRRSIVNALTWTACALPFALITRSVQSIHAAGASDWWQRPFIAGDALAFYVLKTVAPIDLCVEYGRTPQAALSHPWSYVVWAVPAGLLALCFALRRRRPIAWLGALLFCAFLLPTLGLIPFSFQAHSTVADRYAYLPMIGVGLILADVVAAFRSNIAVRVASGLILVLAILSYNQTSSWADNLAFLRHTIEVNPDVAFAQNNFGNILLREKRFDTAAEHFKKVLELEPDHALAHNNLGLCLVQLGRPDEAEPHFRKAVELDPKYFKAHENLGALYLRSNRLDLAVASLKAAVESRPSEAKAFNDLGIAFMQSGRAAEGLDAFQHAVGLEPNNAQYRRNLGIALMQLGRPDEAAQYLGK